MQYDLNFQELRRKYMSSVSRRLSGTLHALSFGIEVTQVQKAAPLQHGTILKYRKSPSATGAPFLRYSPYSASKCSISVGRHTISLNEHKLPRKIPLARH